MTSPIVIWGAGAIGGTLGAAFIRAGHEVVFVDNVKEHVDAINARGLQIKGPIFEDTVKARAYLPEEIEGVYERIFLCVKGHHTEAAAKTLAPHLAEDGYVVSAQNGLNEAVIGRVVGDERVIGCFVNFGADYLEPGIINYGGRAAVVVGEMDGKTTERIKAIHAMMLQFEERAVLTDNISGYLWGKLIYGALLFATAVTNDSIADVFANPAYRPVLTRLAHEVGHVAKASNVRPEAFDGFDPAAFAPTAPAEETGRSFDGMVAHNRRSTKSHTGVWRDLAVRKRKTEVDAQILPIAETGKALGIATPVTFKLVELIHEIEEGKRPLDTANLDELVRIPA
ncbi:2-dehydropantoate 2-reductase [Aliirhizobium terrae]|uniref:ketopantoate reductase family protein n=1 Tax=Terrirhizobium terrae TaxID=2926709 RepID=UPI0025764ADC|nr:2-dehydropantoate 2-reductase [Rhizobium sp. CC-CFT758]WJH41465.1 2-dehydropantoate 2-reductase [Rhizobium sp. CC-CFT758]